jgi:hypothetical protein
MSGQTGLLRMVSVHLTADLSAWASDDDVLIRWMVNPDFGGSFASGVLVPMGPERWGPRSEEWVFHQQRQPDDPDAHDAAKVLARLRTTLGIPDDFEIKVHNISRRHAINQACVSQSMEFHHINTELGYTYESTAVIDDGSAPHVALDPVRIYQPRTRPGHPLPHAYVEREGQRVPIGNLLHTGRFLLLAGERGQDWVDAAAAVTAETGIPITAGTVGVVGCDDIDVRAAWTRSREISPDGAVLERPDRRVAFRSLTAVDDPVATLRHALSSVLSARLT